MKKEEDGGREGRASSEGGKRQKGKVGLAATEMAEKEDKRGERTCSNR